MMFWPEEKGKIKNPDMRLRIQYAEYLVLLAKYSEAVECFEDILKNSNNEYIKAVAVVGLAVTNSLWFKDKTHNTSFNYYKQVVSNIKLKDTHIYGRALMGNAKLYMAVSGGFKKALPIFEQYQKQFKNGRYKREAMYWIACCCLYQGKISKAKEIYTKLKNGKDAYVFFLKNRIENIEQKNN